MNLARSCVVAYVATVVYVLVSLAAAQAALAKSHSATGAPAVGAERTLRVASELDFPPLALVKPDGSADGFSVDLFKAVARVMDFKYRIYTGSWDSIRGDVVAGKADLLINMAINPARAAVHDFTVPHTVTHAAIFVRKGGAPIHALEDLRGKSLLVVAGDHVQQWAAEQPWATNLVPVDSGDEAMKLLAGGKHDAALVARIVGLLILKSARLDNLDVARPSLPGAEQKFAFAVKKGDSGLLSQLNEGLAIVRADGTYNEIYEKWFNPIEPRGIPLRELVLYATPVLGLSLVVMFLLAYRLRLSVVILRNERAALESRVAARTVDLLHSRNEAEQANRAKSEFLASVTHELKSPLNSVIGFAGLLKDEVPGQLNAKQAVFAADILASGQRLLALVEGILEMSRLDAAGAVLEPVEIGVALEQRVAAHRKAAEARGVTIGLEVAPGAANAELDPKALRRMLDALLDNAVKFNREGGRVAVSARRAGGAFEIAVADTGIGIAREDLAKLFKPLAQLDAGLARRNSGVGLGLALARRLAELHGGTLDVESEPGKGSTFTLRFPAQEKS